MPLESITQVHRNFHKDRDLPVPATAKLWNGDDLSDGEAQQIEELAYQYGRTSESYDAAISHDLVLMTPCWSGAVGIHSDGNIWHIAGGILAPELLKSEMINWLTRISIEHRKTIAVYNVCQNDAVKFAEFGFVVNKLGEEPMVRLHDLSWSGKKFQWIRQQSNSCIRAGITIEEITGAEHQIALEKTLAEILADDLSERSLDKPLRLLETEFNPRTLRRRRLFIARNANNEIEAFLACSPMNSGRSWAFETYRKRKSATRGVTAHLFRTVIDQLKSQGVEKVSLCLVPGRNVSHALIKNGDWKVEKMLTFWFKRLHFLFNAKGQDHFKSRFRPDYEDRYLCVTPQHSIRSVWSFLKTTGAIHCNWKNLASQFGYHMKHNRR